MRCIAWPRVAAAALVVGLVTGVGLPLALGAPNGGARSAAVIDASQLAAALAAGLLVSRRQRWLHTWVTFFACVFLAGGLAALVGSLS